jgi:glyoxylate reductase
VAHIFVTRGLPGPALERLKQAHEVELWPERLPPSPDELSKHARNADGLLTMLTDRVDAKLIESAPKLKVISNYAVGLDNVDLKTATRENIPVGHTPDVLTDATADLTFALLLAAARKLPQALEAARTDWHPWEPTLLLGQEVHGATLGIIGFGRIGRAVAQRAGGFEMEVLHTTTGGDPGVDQDELLERSDFVSLHAPLTPETHHLVDQRTLELMKPTAILINTARGQMVDQDALLRALDNGAIGGAALDVTDPEPLPDDHPLHRAPNLVLTPHIGSATRVARERMAEIAVENLLAGLEGRAMPHQANELP